MENGGYIFTRCSIQCLRVQRNTVQIASILKMLFTLNSSTVFKICGCITCIWTLSVLSVMSYISSCCHLLITYLGKADCIKHTDILILILVCKKKPMVLEFLS